jgi:heptosyltransferase-1
MSETKITQGSNRRLQSEQKFRRILFVDWSMIGDLVMLSPAVHAVRQAYPDSHIAILGQPTSIAVFKEDAAVNELIPFQRSGPGKEWNLKLFFSTVRKIREGRFDLAIIAHNSIGSALMCFLAGVRKRVGYSGEFRDWMLTRTVPQREERQHLIRVKLNLVAACGIEVEDRPATVCIDQKKAKAWLKDKLGPNFGRSRPIISLALGSTQPYKQWTPSEANRLLKMLPVNSCDIVFVGSPAERSQFEGVYSFNNTVVDLVGETTIEELMWVLNRADLHIGPDSGPMHIAIGLGTPVVALFGGTDPVRCGPYQYEESRVVRSHRCCPDCARMFGRFIVACTHTIDASEVFVSANELLGGKLQ